VYTGSCAKNKLHCVQRRTISECECILLAGVSGSSASSFSSFRPSSYPPMPGGPTFGSAATDLEMATLQRMRQRAEREQLIAQLKAEDETPDAA